MPDYKQIKNIMCRLGCSEEEAKQVIADDLAIDKGEKLFELSEEERKAETAIKRTTSGERKQTAKPTKKTNPDKLHLMHIIETAIKYNPDTSTYTTTQAEREAEFVYKGVKYKITLSCPRS